MAQQPEHHEHMHVSDPQKQVHVELDVNDVEVPFTKERLIGLQLELLDALGADAFQDRLCECEETLGKGTMEFRKRHQQLVLEVQSTLLPKYGFEPSMQGVANMLKAVKGFSEDKEVASNIKEINALIWKPHHSHHFHEHHEHHEHSLDWVKRWHQPDAAHDPAKAPLPAGDFDTKHVGVEIDMDAVPVPFTRDRALGLQKELREHFGDAGLQARLKELVKAHGEGTMEYRKEHQRLILEVQSKILPKYGFKGDQQGVHDMMDAVKGFESDADVAANLKAIDALLWKSGHAPEGHHPDPNAAKKFPDNFEC